MSYISSSSGIALYIYILVAAQTLQYLYDFPSASEVK